MRTTCYSPEMLRAALFASTIALASAAQAADCLPYEPETTTVSGTVRTGVAYVGPTFGEHPDTDRKERFFTLVLDEPACVLPKDGADDLALIDEAENDVRQMQLLFGKDHAAALVVGRHVRVTGELTHQITMHHHTKVMIMVKRVDATH